MQVLCIKMAELLRKHPTLWLPYLAADLLAICLWRLRGVAERGIFRWFTTGHSVLGGEVPLPPHDSATLAKASIAYAPIAIVAIIAVVSLFVAALVATAVIVDSIERDQRPDSRMILEALLTRWRRIVLFSLRFLVTVGIFIGGTAGLSYYLLSIAHRQGLINSFWFLAAGMLLGVGCTGWLVLPAAVRLLRGVSALVSVKTRIQGTILAVLAAEAGAVLGFFVPSLETSLLLTSHGENNVLSIFNSIVANAPDALLFIALALLTADLSRNLDDGKNSKLRELLPVLMPMHFEKGGTQPE